MNVSILNILELVILQTKIAECILKFIDEIYQVLVHFYALDRFSNRERFVNSMVWVVRVGSRDLTPFGNCICSCCFPSLAPVELASTLGTHSGFLCTHHPLPL